MLKLLVVKIEYDKLFYLYDLDFGLFCSQDCDIHTCQKKKKKKDCDIHAALERLISVSLFQEKGKQTILQLGRVVKSKYVMDYR